jgi:hypothetical protein
MTLQIAGNVLVSIDSLQRANGVTIACNGAERKFIKVVDESRVGVMRLVSPPPILPLHD